MKILITEVAGFIGSNLAKRLLDRGHSVIGIDNLNYGFLRNIEFAKTNPNFEFIMGDIANPLMLCRNVFMINQRSFLRPLPTCMAKIRTFLLTRIQLL